MKLFRLLLALGTTLGTIGCRPPSIAVTESVGGSGKMATANRAVSGFHSVAMNTSGRLEVEQGATESLTVSADDNVLPLLTSDVSDGQLTLGFKSNINVKSNTPIAYKLTMKQLDGLTLAGNGAINAKWIQTPTLNVNVAGSGDVAMAGSADQQ